jgi:rod shape-determining protein MreC
MAVRSRQRSARLLVVTLVSISLATITMDYRQGESGPLAGIGRLGLRVITPLQETVSKATRPIGDFFSGLWHLPSLERDNARLRSEIDELRAQITLSASDKARLDELEAFYNIRKSLPGPTVTAAVISNGVSNFEWTVIIDKGSSDGIGVDMPVIASGGLVGHVVRVTPNAALVQLIIDPRSKVAVRFVSSGETGLLEGQGEEDMRMELVEAATPIDPGEAVQTAGYQHGLYPRDIVVGTVAQASQDPAALEKLVTVRPAVDFSSLDFVQVLLPAKAGG